MKSTLLILTMTLLTACGSGGYKRLMEESLGKNIHAVMPAVNGSPRGTQETPEGKMYFFEYRYDGQFTNAMTGSILPINDYCATYIYTDKTDTITGYAFKGNSCN